MVMYEMTFSSDHNMPAKPKLRNAYSLQTTYLVIRYERKPIIKTGDTMILKWFTFTVKPELTTTSE
jgi:hypothetical protein